MLNVWLQNLLYFYFCQKLLQTANAVKIITTIAAAKIINAQAKVGKARRIRKYFIGYRYNENLFQVESAFWRFSNHALLQGSFALKFGFAGTKHILHPPAFPLS